MKELLALAKRLMPVDVTVLIQGESGTGKEVVARAIHEGSARRNGPFIAINCAAVPETLPESEFFGDEAGAFTGAAHRKAGRFAAADGGTLFLDEVTELPLTAQAKLLRVIQERELTPLGGTGSRSIDVRIIAATNQDLARLVAVGRFRRDLYYRLHVVPLHVPPLRERPADIPALAIHFLRCHPERADQPVGEFTGSAMQALSEHSWPGNVRELEHAVQRAVVLRTAPEITPEDLRLTVDGGLEPPAPDSPASLGTTEREFIFAALRECGGNRTAAARRLGIDRSTMWRRLRAYGLSDECPNMGRTRVATDTDADESR